MAGKSKHRKCEECGKRSYASKMQALSAALHASRYGKSWRVYYSGKCRTWHLTTRPYLTVEQLKEREENGWEVTPRPN